MIDQARTSRQSCEMRPLVVTMGDPAGIGPEIILKAVRDLSRRGWEIPLVVVGDFPTLEAAALRVDEAPRLCRYEPGRSLSSLRQGLVVMSVDAVARGPFVPGRPTVEGAAIAYESIVKAVKMVLGQEASGLVTAPVSKEWITLSGRPFVGHSELLAELSGTHVWRMMFAGELLRVALVTAHMALADVPGALSVEAVFDTIALCADHLRQYLGIQRPRIAVLGLNPHAGENGLFGNEEARFIKPAIERAKETGLDVIGPLPADSAFVRIREKREFDAFVAMYHDQGLLPVKTLDFERSVNVTLGLPFVRTSPDHGTAFDIAGRGVADSTSLESAIIYAWRAVSGKRDVQG